MTMHEVSVSEPKGQTMKWGMYWPLMVVVALLGCSSTPSNGTVEPEAPIESESPEVQADFEDALSLLEDGRWDDARQELYLLQGEHRDDATADLAELYIARSYLGDLDEIFGEPAEELREPVEREVFGLLGPLAASEGLDDRIRSAAQSYLALAYLIDGELVEGLEVIADYPGASMSPVVLTQDRTYVWPVIAQGLSEAGRKGDALKAWGDYHKMIVDDDEREDERLQFVVTRAFEDADAVESRQLSELVTDRRSLTRVAATWGLIRRHLDGGVNGESVESLQAFFNDMAPEFASLGLGDRASELSMALSSQAGPQRLVIGALLPLSGPNRSVGNRALAGMLVAQRSFHQAGDPAVTLLIEDSHGDPEAAYERLVNDGATAVVGPLRTDTARAIAPMVESHGVPTLALAADRIGERTVADDEERNGRAPMFRNFVDSVAEARAAAKIAHQRLGDQRAAIVHPDMGYGRVLALAFRDEFEARGGEVVIEVEYDRSSSDYESVAREVASARPEAVFIPDSGSKVAELSAFFAQEQMWGSPAYETPPDDGRLYVHYLGTSLWQAPIIAEQASSYLKGAIVPAWFSREFRDRETTQLARSFEAIYESEVDHFVAFAYDSVQRLRSFMLDRGLNTSEAIVEALYREEWANGATGRFAFDEFGEPRRELRFLSVGDRSWEVFEETVVTPLKGRQALEREIESEDLDDFEEESSDELEDEEGDDEIVPDVDGVPEVDGVP